MHRTDAISQTAIRLAYGGAPCKTPPRSNVLSCQIALTPAAITLLPHESSEARHKKYDTCHIGHSCIHKNISMRLALYLLWHILCVRVGPGQMLWSWCLSWVPNDADKTASLPLLVMRLLLLAGDGACRWSWGPVMGPYPSGLSSPSGTLPHQAASAAVKNHFIIQTNEWANCWLHFASWAGITLSYSLS